MPTIFKPKKKTKNDTEKLRKRRQIYDSTLWRKMRMGYQMAHPLCEVCEMEGKATLAEETHHLTSFLDVPEELMMQYAYDSNNFISVCKECHSRLHTKDLKGCKTKETIRKRIENNQSKH